MEYYDRIKVLIKDKGVTVDKMMKDVFGPESNGGRFQMMKMRGIYPRVDDAYKIAQYFGVTVEWLLTGEDTKSDTTTEEENMFLDAFRDLNGTAKATILSLMMQLKSNSKNQ